jgi:hypothetical protein
MRRVPAALSPGLLVKLPLNFISAPETLSPMVAWRLWWCTGAAVAWPWCAPVVRTVLVVVVVVVVAAGVLRAVVAWVRLGPSRRVLRLGRAVERVVRVVRGATVRLLRAMSGMIAVVSVGW